MNEFVSFIVDTFDLKSNETFRKVIGTIVTVVALISGLVQAIAGAIEVVAP